MSWRVRRVGLPPDVLIRKEEALQLIREAIDAMGDIFDRHRYVAVNVEFDLSSAL